MGCPPFKITLTGDLEETFEKIKSAIEGLGGSVSGDKNKGELFGLTPFGPIAGNYTVEGNELEVSVSKKPMLVPCGMIESKVRDYFG